MDEVSAEHAAETVIAAAKTVQEAAKTVMAAAREVEKAIHTPNPQTSQNLVEQVAEQLKPVLASEATSTLPTDNPSSSDSTDEEIIIAEETLVQPDVVDSSHNEQKE